MNGTLKIRLIVTDEHGKRKHLNMALGSSEDNITGDHDMAALMFACEFAINNHASQILGKAVRAHFEILPE